MFGLHHLALGGTLAHSLVYAAAAIGTFEVDLIFPRNGTYAPVPLMPVVFAVQNPALASPLDLLIEWTAFEYGSDSRNGTQQIGLSNLNASTSNPYFVTSYISSLSGIESTWVFNWVLTTGNCSQTGGHATYDNQVEYVVFTTNQTSPAPDLEGATSAATCAMSPAQAFNVTAVEFAPQGYGNGVSSCAVLGPSPTAANPCAAAIDSSAASSITAAISLSRCSATEFLCGATPSSAKSEAGRSVRLPSMWVLTTMASLLLLDN